MNIVYEDIEKGDYLKVNVEDLGDPQWAKAYTGLSDTNELYVVYLSDTGDYTTEGYTLWALETNVTQIHCETLVEHYPGVKDITQLGFVKLRDCLYVNEDDIEEDDDEDSLDGFIVRDEDMEDEDIPRNEDFPRDVEWELWKPQTQGQQRFKDKIDLLEEKVRADLDERRFNGGE